jgi:hypothetical protein
MIKPSQIWLGLIIYENTKPKINNLNTHKIAEGQH